MVKLQIMYYVQSYFILISFIALAIPSHAKTIFVDDNAPAGGDGASWASAHKYLQDALAGAEYGDEIWVAEGTYKPDQGAGKTAGDRTASFNLVNGVGLYGGFLGRESDRDPQGDNNQTILSGEIDSNSSLWSLHVVSGENLDTGTTLAGFRITKGNANGVSGTGHDYGGGILLKESSLNLSNLVFTNNTAGSGGGISSSSSSTVTLTNCVFTNNTAGSGGGIYSSTATLINCVFTNNTAGDFGGGIYSSSTVTLTNCVFTNNSAGGGGGGIHSYSVTLTNCVFTNNTAGSGGGIYSSTATLINCVFTNNTAGDFGGGISSSLATLINCVFTDNTAGSRGNIGGSGGGIYSSYSVTLINCVFTNNTADSGRNTLGSGGAIYSDSATLTNCVFTNNTAGSGGAIYSTTYSDTSTVTLTNCVFTNNTAGYDGGAIFSWYVTLNNCVLWQNKTNGMRGHGLYSNKSWKTHVLEDAVESAYPGDPNVQEIVYQPNLNILQGWEGDIRAFDADPLFTNIDNPIGPDGIWFTEDDGLRVLTGSPAIDAGYNESLPADTSDLDKDGNTTEPIPYDALGKARRIGANVDIGAYEFGHGNPPSEKKLALSLTAGNGGSVNGAGYLEEGVVANISATASTGYIFSNWSGDASGSSNPLSISMDADKSITANFSQDLGDTDGDGLSNYAELVTHRTDPDSLDSDNDGLTDKQEIDRGWNPNSSDKSVIDAVMEMKGLDSIATPFVNGWFYLPNHGWLWTNHTSYPYFYDSTSKAWMYFQSGNDNPRFYHYGTKTWMTVE